VNEVFYSSDVGSPGSFNYSGILQPGNYQLYATSWVSPLAGVGVQSADMSLALTLTPFTPVPVPEPTFQALGGIGMLALLGMRRGKLAAH